MSTWINLPTYRQLRNDFPHLFLNDEKSTFEILDEPPLYETKKSNRISVQEGKLEILVEAEKDEQDQLYGVLVNDPYLLVLRDRVRFTDGIRGYIRTIDRGTVRNGHGVAVLPLDKNGIVLVHHFRHATREWHWEIPRGFAEAKTTATKLARTELLEEIGAREAKNFNSLGFIHTDTGVTNGKAELLICSSSGPYTPSKAESIDKIEIKTKSEVQKMIQTGQITDSFTIVAFFQASIRNFL